MMRLRRITMTYQLALHDKSTQLSKTRIRLRFCSGQRYAHQPGRNRWYQLGPTVWAHHTYPPGWHRIDAAPASQTEIGRWARPWDFQRPFVAQKLKVACSLSDNHYCPKPHVKATEWKSLGRSFYRLMMRIKKFFWPYFWLEQMG